jgi:pyrroline-5-carboxylate reductase
MKALLIGCGKMGGALLGRWVKSPEWSFTVVDPMAQDLPDDVRLFRDRDELGSELFDLVIVAVKPQLIDAVLPGYEQYLGAAGCVGSIAAGCSVARLHSALGDVSVIRIMPNLPASIGQGVSGLFAGPKCTPAQRNGVESLMQQTGTTVWVDEEDALDRVTAVAGSGPGYVFEIARTYIEAAEALGFTTAQARALVLDTMAGAVEMARRSDESVETLRNSVTSKNGTTQAGLDALNGDGTLTELMRRTTRAAYDRAVELR